MRCRPLHALAVVVLALGLVAVCAPAWAHEISRAADVIPSPPPLTETLMAASPDVGIPWTALALLAGVAVGAVSRQRRAVALTLVLVVSLLVFETGVHSTHHLRQPEDSRSCAVAWMSTQLSADVVDVSIDASPALAPEASIPTLAAPALAQRAVALDAGRAPPVLSA